ncbi:uncharacterized protein LOC142345307 [Convolutriloba macropyga]|uniref:uncharacterized protein LOC142345307 n=1 Tax=Convolutriloba macropyga TaxID=536237 RepID=UPI003F51FC85
MITVFMIVFILVPLACIAIGGVGIKECKVEQMIPIWLIVFGSAFIIFLIICIAVQITTRKKLRKMDDHGTAELRASEQSLSVAAVVVLVILLLFLLAWFIVGNVYVFENWQTVDSDPKSCNELVYYFAFAVIVMVYVVALVTCCLCCMIVCTTAVVAVEERQQTQKKG